MDLWHIYMYNGGDNIVFATALKPVNDFDKNLIVFMRREAGLFPFELSSDFVYSFTLTCLDNILNLMLLL